MKTTIKKTTGIYENKIIEEYNDKNQLIKATHYHEDNKTIFFIFEYKNGEKFKQIIYQDDGKTISSITKFYNQ